MNFDEPTPSTGRDSANSDETFTGDEPLSVASVAPNSIEGLFLRALQIQPAKERDNFISQSCRNPAHRSADWRRTGCCSQARRDSSRH